MEIKTFSQMFNDKHFTDYKKWNIQKQPFFVMPNKKRTISK